MLILNNIDLSGCLAAALHIHNRKKNPEKATTDLKILSCSPIETNISGTKVD